MKFKRFTGKKYSWHNWFAWYPVIAYLDSGMGSYWVWLSRIKRIREQPSKAWKYKI